ncbi:MAG: HEAT repeat domain-containing protein [Planctomycetota bacterium]|jgi:hypothetical protein
MRRICTLLSVALLLSLAAPPAALADEGEGDSPAEKAYQDGWWAETSSGRLDEALRHYETAAAAEGPAAVRARALYRSAVVLERMGRTGDAIHVLDQLAAAYPQEAELQAKAQARLAEWTSEDLRASFDDWYQRYQYSPEFQAHIVDLVLKLSAKRVISDASAPANAVIDAATQELLTIGEPAVPALRAHVDSANTTLCDRVVKLLLEIGSIPPARALMATTSWRFSSDAWRSILTAPEAERERLRDELAEEDHPLAAALRAASTGPGAAVAVLATPLDDRARARALAALAVAVTELPVARALSDDLLAIIDTPRASPRVAEVLVRRLLERGLVPPDRARRWLRYGPPVARVYVVRSVLEGTLAAPDLWQDVVAGLDDTPVASNSVYIYDLFLALQRAVSDAPADADLTPAVRAVERAWPSGRVNLGSPGRGTGVVTGGFSEARPTSGDRLVAALVEQARDPEIAYRALRVWDRLHANDPIASRPLLRWAEAGLDPQVRLYAAKMAGHLADAATLDEVLAALDAFEPAEANQVWSGLAHNSGLQALPWSDERVREVMATALRSHERRHYVGTPTQEIVQFFGNLLSTQHRVEQVIDLGLEDPRSLWVGAVGQTHRDIRQAPAVIARVRDGFRSRWTDWTPEQRHAALVAFDPLLGLADLRVGDSFEQFLRQLVRASWGVHSDPRLDALQRQMKDMLVARLPALELADLRGAFDLDDPEQAIAAQRFNTVPRTPAVYEALAGAARRHPDPGARRTFWFGWFQAEGAELHRRILVDMLEDPDGELRKEALGRLRSNAVSDLPFFMKALEDPYVPVRILAADHLGRVFDDAAVKALVQALDDPNALVRDAVLASLEKIKQIEEQKAYWREFAEGGGR